MFIADCKQTIDRGYKSRFRQGVFIKRIQELAKTSHGLISSEWFTLVGGIYIDQSSADNLVLEML